MNQKKNFIIYVLSISSSEHYIAPREILNLESPELLKHVHNEILKNDYGFDYIITSNKKILDNKVPEEWSYLYLSYKPLSSWILDL